MVIDLEEKDSLRFILKYKSKDYYFKFFTLLGELDKVQAREDVVYRAQHGTKHCEIVEKNINDLLPITLKRKMSPKEIFCLLSSIWFHDIGEIFDEKGKDFTYIRSHDYIYKHYEEWKLEESEADIITQILKEVGRERHEEEILEKETTSIRFFACLLRIADKLDIGYGSVPRELLTPWEKSFKTRTILLLLKERFDVEMRIDSEHWLIEILLLPKLEILDNPQLIKDIYEKIKIRLNKDLDCFKSLFYQNGLGYQEIKVSLPPQFIKESSSIREKPFQPSPYKFLEYYEISDKDIFFGRKQDIAKFVGHILSNKLVVIYGESLIGKTSLIKAGIIPKLREGNVVIYINCESDPLSAIKDEIEKELKRERIRSFKLDKSLPLVDFFKNIDFPFSVIIFIDHFENFFKQVPAEAKEQFIDEVAVCTYADKPSLVKFVFSIRKDFFVQLGNFKYRLPELFNNAFELTRLTESEAREAIVSPAKLFNIEYAGELLEALIWDIRDEQNLIAPIHIQIVCHRLVDTLNPELLKDILPQTITYEWYDNLGGVPGILGDYLEETIKKMEELSSKDKEQAKGILKVMVTSFESHPQMNVKEICAFMRIEEDKLRTILTSLVSCGLLRKVKKDTYKLISDYLLNSITKKWLTRKDVELREMIENITRSLDDWRAHHWYMEMTLLSKIYLYREDLPLLEDTLELLLRSSLRHHFPIWFWVKKLEPDKVKKILLDEIKSADSEGIKRIINVLGKEGILAIDHLILRLNDTEPRVRKAVIEVLGQLKDSRTVDFLLQRLSDSDAEVRDAAANALGNIGTPRILDVFISQLEHADWRLRKAAADGLGVMKTTKSLEALFKKINDPDSEVRKAVVTALGKLGNTKALTPLIRRLKDSSAEVREAAAEALGNLGSPLSVEDLLLCFHDKVEKVREAAVRALGKLGDEKALEPLLEIADDPDTDVRNAVAEALANLHTPRTKQVLLDRLREPEWWKKEMAAIALGKTGAPDVLEYLLAGLDDPDWRIRVAMANGLKLLALSNTTVEEVLMRRLHDPHEEVRKATIMALGKLGTEKVLTSIISSLSDVHIQVRVAASWTLGMIGTLEVLEPLLYRLSDPSEEVKTACLEALQKIDEKFYRKNIDLLD